jgi:acetyl-CoA acyltransferase 2
METIVFIAAKRTPFGAFGGSLKTWTATDLAVHAAKAALAQSKIPKENIGHVIFGNVMQTSSDAAYLSRHVGLRTELPENVPAVTVNRLCGSGFEAIAQGVQRILLGETETVLVGGTESMSQAPYVLRSGRFGYRLGHGDLEDSLTSGLYDTFPKMPMAITAENLAEKYSLTRAQCDEFALFSQKNASTANFKDEIAPVMIKSKAGDTELAHDEHPRKDSTIEGLQKLKPLFKKEGVVTAGNASGMVDGATALVITTLSNAKKHGCTILGEWVQSHVVGCDPKIMGIGPVPATQGALKKASLNLKDISLFEVNEAFAAQTLAVQKELGIPTDKLNVDGGAIAIGHPLGASGARLVTHLLYRLKAKGGGLGSASACIGGGQGMTVLVKV